MFPRPWREIGMVSVLVILSGCSQGDTGHAASSAETLLPASAQAALAAVDESERPTAETIVEMQAPAGWARSTKGAWTLWSSADGRVQLALATLPDADQTPARVKAMEGVFGVTQVRLTDRRPIAIGSEHMAAQSADGAARFASGDGGIAYAVVQTGGPNQVFVAYAFEKDATPEARRAVNIAVGSLRKK